MYVEIPIVLCSVETAGSTDAVLYAVLISHSSVLVLKERLMCAMDVENVPVVFLIKSIIHPSMLTTVIGNSFLQAVKGSIKHRKVSSG